jgi:Kef-type K+ transport system membrane component KefB
VEEVGHILLNFGIILGAGLLAQLVATFLRIPEMIVLVAAGALIGPSVLGIASNPPRGVGAQLIFTLGRPWSASGCSTCRASL